MYDAVRFHIRARTFIQLRKSITQEIKETPIKIFNWIKFCKSKQTISRISRTFAANKFV